LRLFLNTRHRLICLDAESGTPATSFGLNGVVDLSEGLLWPINKLDYTNTSPPVIYIGALERVHERAALDCRAPLVFRDPGGRQHTPHRVSRLEQTLAAVQWQSAAAAHGVT
jgi:hypothetical protein